MHFTARPLGFLVEQVTAVGASFDTDHDTTTTTTSFDTDHDSDANIRRSSAPPAAAFGSAARALLSPPSGGAAASRGEEGALPQSSRTMVSSISKHCEWSHVLQEGDRLIAVGSTQDLARPNKKKKKKKKKGGKVADASFASKMINVRQMEPEKVADQLETLRLPITVQLQRPDLACVSLLKHRGLVPDEGDDGRKRHEFQKVWRALSMRVIDMQCRESGRPTDWLQKLHGDNKLMRQVIKHQKKWGVVGCTSTIIFING